MMLLAYGPAENAEPVVSIELLADGSLTIELEREESTETLHITAPSVCAHLRDLAREQAAA